MSSPRLAHQVIVEHLPSGRPKSGAWYSTTSLDLPLDEGHGGWDGKLDEVPFSLGRKVQGGGRQGRGRREQPTVAALKRTSSTLQMGPHKSTLARFRPAGCPLRNRMVPPCPLMGVVYCNRETPWFPWVKLFVHLPSSPSSRSTRPRWLRRD